MDKLLREAMDDHFQGVERAREGVQYLVEYLSTPEFEQCPYVSVSVLLDPLKHILLNLEDPL